MKKTFKAFWLALMGVVWLVLMASSCRKAPPEPEPDLPPETQTGAGTIGCYINGKPWWPKSYWAPFGTPYLELGYSANTFGFYLRSQIPLVTDKIKGTGSLYIQIPTLLKKGDNEIWYDPFHSSSIFQSFDTSTFKNPCFGFRLDTLKPRRLTITRWDNIGGGATSGTFEFTAFNTCGDTLHFTKGRFDY